MVYDNVRYENLKLIIYATRVQVFIWSRVLLTPSDSSSVVISWSLKFGANSKLCISLRPRQTFCRCHICAFSWTLQWRHNECGASQITGVSMVCSAVCSGADHRKHQSSASLAFVGEFTGERWIPLTKGQGREKYFHLMSSSCESLVKTLIGSSWLVANIHIVIFVVLMMTSSNGKIFGVTGPLWGESTGDRRTLLEKAIDAGLWCFL